MKQEPDSPDPLASARSPRTPKRASRSAAGGKSSAAAGSAEGDGVGPSAKRAKREGWPEATRLRVIGGPEAAAAGARVEKFRSEILATMGEDAGTVHARMLVGFLDDWCRAFQDKDLNAYRRRFTNRGDSTKSQAAAA